MLDLMRKHAGSWIIKILLGAIAVAFALSWGVSSYYSRKEVAVTVNGEPITMAQLQEEHGRMVEANRHQFGEQFDRVAPMLRLKERALNTLIDRALLFQAAKRLGINASDQEVAQILLTFQAFQRGGRFDKDQYRRVLAANRLTPETFENLQRGEIILTKLTTMVAGAAQVSPLELEQTLDEALGKVQGVYLTFAEETYLKGLTAGAEDIEAYYQEHKREYMIPEKLRVSYVVFPLADYRDKARVSDDDVAEYYESQRGQYVVPEAVHARHILISVAENAPAEQLAKAKAKAEVILAEVRDKGADFAALAKKESQDTGSAAAGGDLGFIQRDTMVPAFEKAVFALQPGQVGLVQTPFGFHVIKVEARREGRVIPLEEVKGELRNKLEEQQARQQAEAAAERLLDQVNAGAKLKDVAAKAKFELQQSPAFSAEETIPGLSGVKGLFEAFDGLMAGQAAPVIPFEGGSLVAVLDDRMPAQAKPMGEVEAEVRLAVLGMKARRLAQEAAEKLIAELKAQPDPAQVLAKRAGAIKTAWLRADDSVPGLTTSAPLLETLFSRPDNARLAVKPVQIGDNYLVVALLGRQAPSAEEKDLHRDEVRQALEKNMQRILHDRFLADLRAKATIKVLAKL